MTADLVSRLKGRVPADEWRLDHRYRAIQQDLTRNTVDLNTLDDLILEMEERLENAPSHAKETARKLMETLTEQRKAIIKREYREYRSGTSQPNNYKRIADIIRGKGPFQYTDRFRSAKQLLETTGSASSYEELDDLRRTIRYLEQNRYVRQKAQRDKEFAQHHQEMLTSLRTRLRKEEECLRVGRTRRSMLVGLTATLGTLLVLGWQTYEKMTAQKSTKTQSIVRSIARPQPTQKLLKKQTRPRAPNREESLPTNSTKPRKLSPRRATETPKPLRRAPVRRDIPWSEERVTRYDRQHLNDYVNRLYTRRKDEHRYHLLVDGVGQRAYLIYDHEIVGKFRVSTGKHGFGNHPGSGRTPVGLHKIVRIIGQDVPLGTVFKGRKPLKIDRRYLLAKIFKTPVDTPNDTITTRILLLDGQERWNRNTYARHIYAHGTNEEGLLGHPVSHGCIRFSNQTIRHLATILERESSLYILGASQSR